MAAKSFEELVVWQKAHQCTLEVYQLTQRFPGREQFGLTSQLRRAAVSVPANIAEGFRKRGNLEKARFYNIAQGSIEECVYYLILAQDLGYADTEGLKSKMRETGRLLAGYVAALHTMK